MKNYLYIDDIRKVNKDLFNKFNIYIVKNYNEAINILNNYDIDIIDLDHDLGEEKTGYDIAKYIVASNIKIKEGFKIHSANSVGRYNISQLLTHYGYRELS